MKSVIVFCLLALSGCNAVVKNSEPELRCGDDSAYIQSFVEQSVEKANGDPTVFQYQINVLGSECYNGRTVFFVTVESIFLKGGRCLHLSISLAIAINLENGDPLYEVVGGQMNALEELPPGRCQAGRA